MNGKNTPNTYQRLAVSLRTMAALATLLLATACTDSSTTNAGPAIETSQSVEARGKTLYFTNPEGYCDYGDSPIEREIIKQAERAIGPVTLLHAAAPCAELKELVAGNRTSLDHWFQIQLVDQTGMGREKFLSNLADQMPAVETDEMRQSWQDAFAPRLAKEGIDLELGEIKYLGRDENALYLSIMAKIEDVHHKGVLTAISAQTLIKGLHVGVNLYDGTEDPQSLKNMPVIVRDFVKHILAANPD